MDSNVLLVQYIPCFETLMAKIPLGNYNGIRAGSLANLEGYEKMWQRELVFPLGKENAEFLQRLEDRVKDSIERGERIEAWTTAHPND